MEERDDHGWANANHSCKQLTPLPSATSTRFPEQSIAANPWHLSPIHSNLLLSCHPPPFLKVLMCTDRPKLSGLGWNVLKKKRVEPMNRLYNRPHVQSVIHPGSIDTRTAGSSQRVCGAASSSPMLPVLLTFSKSFNRAFTYPHRGCASLRLALNRQTQQAMQSAAKWLRAAESPLSACSFSLDEQLSRATESEHLGQYHLLCLAETLQGLWLSSFTFYATWERWAGN